MQLKYFAKTTFQLTKNLDNLKTPLSECSLMKHIQSIVNKSGKPQIDLLASRANKKLPKYMFWKPDPGSVATDAFSVALNPHLTTAFLHLV